MIEREPYITKENYVTATFVNSERITVEVLLSRENANEVTPHIFEAVEDNIDYQDLLKVITVDELHEATHRRISAEAADFKTFALQVAKDSGLVQSENLSEKRKAWPSIVKIIFGNPIEEEEDLFALKLALFEVEKIRISKNAAVKTQLRKSKTKFEVLHFAFIIAAEADAAAALLPVPEKKKKTAAEKKADAAK